MHMKALIIRAWGERVAEHSARRTRYYQAPY